MFVDILCDQRFGRYRIQAFWPFWGRFGRFYQKGVLCNNFTGLIRNKDHKLDRKKLVPLITSDIDTYLTLPLVYWGKSHIHMYISFLWKLG